MITWLETYAKTHIFYIILIVMGVIGTRAWLAEHDARVLAEQTVKQSDARVKDLQQQIVNTNALAASAVANVRTIVLKASTPTQVVAAVPQLTDVPLNTRVAVDNPSQVSVDAQPFVALLGQCKQDAINLGACTQNVNTCQQIVKERETEVAVLKKKPAFWKRLTGQGKAAAFGIVVFEVVKVVLTHQL